MYKSLTNIARMFDVSTSFIKKHYDLIEGVHYKYVGNMKRFNVDEMTKLLVTDTKEQEEEDPILKRFFI